MTTVAGLNTDGVQAVSKLLATLDSLTLNEGMTVSGCVETEDQRIYFAADADGQHRLTGTGPK